jgi:prepilin-type N-terminal cleavage/methylation domain-containing protein
MNIFKNSNLKCHKGFTLAEILLAMLITSVLILGVNASYRQAHLTWSNIENKRPVYHTARFLTEILRQELSCLYFPPSTDEDEDSLSPFKLLYLPNEGTELTFYTLTPFWKGAIESSCMARIRYRFFRDPDTDRILIERSEQPCAGEKIIGQESIDVITSNLSELRTWAVDPNSSDTSWTESYESKDKPPKALKFLFKSAVTDKIPDISFEHCVFMPSNSSIQ